MPSCQSLKVQFSGSETSEPLRHLEEWDETMSVGEQTNNSNCENFFADVMRGLSQSLKTLPSHWLYDAQGSLLFSKITEVEEYDLTRNETEILLERAGDIAKRVFQVAAGRKVRVVELGAGDGTKTEILLRALQKQSSGEQTNLVEYWPIDISPTALDVLCGRLQAELASVCHPVVGDNLSGLKQIVSTRTPSGVSEEILLILDLGSSIGNRSREAVNQVLREVRDCLKDDDLALIGFDLVKDSRKLIAAYDDALGVTRDFNLNLLTRMNKELGSNFDLSAFRHEATWNPELAGMESWLVSLKDQDVVFPAMGRSSGTGAGPNTAKTIHFRKWEPLRTEISLKFTREGVALLAAAHDYQTEEVYEDQGGNFVDALWRAQKTKRALEVPSLYS